VYYKRSYFLTIQQYIIAYLEVSIQTLLIVK